MIALLVALGIIGIVILLCALVAVFAVIVGGSR